MLKSNLFAIAILLLRQSSLVTAWQSVSSTSQPGSQLPLRRRSNGTIRRSDGHSVLSVAQNEAVESIKGGIVGTSSSSSSSKQKVAVLLCPAQFCVPGDYTDFWPTLRKTLEDSDSPIELAGSSRVVPLSRLDWIKVARQLPTMEFLQAKLPVRPTLIWYFEAIEQALADILAAEGPDVQIAFVGHSIGGWVARAYLGGLSQSASATFRLATERCTALITLGTPHISPREALVDQTRGLLEAIEATPACSPKSLLEDAGISFTCVASQALVGSWMPTNIEGFVAAASYAPLTGKWSNVKGDGIVPLDLALLPEPARSIVLEKDAITDQDIHHLHVLPTPWNIWDPSAPSLPLGFSSYVSPGVVLQWAQYLHIAVATGEAV